MVEGAGWLPGAPYKGINHILKGSPLVNSSLAKNPHLLIPSPWRVRTATPEIYWDTLIFIKLNEWVG